MKAPSSATVSYTHLDVYKRQGLDDVFAFSLSAIDVGAAKPEALIFEEACQRLQALPEQIVHVGDDPIHDVQGGLAAGFRTVWVLSLIHI